MTSLDILFWLLAALLGGLVWAVEAGLASRHRTVMLSSMASTLLTMLFLMFFVDDKSNLVPFEPEKFAKSKGGPPGSAQEDNSGGGEGGGGGGGGQGGGSGDSGSGNDPNASSDGGGRGSGGGSASSGGGAGSGSSGNALDVDANSIEYSREPFSDCPQCPDLIIVPRGVAKIGAAKDDPVRQAGEQAETVMPIAKPFAIGRLELTRREFAFFAAETGFQSKTPCDVGKRRGVFSWERPGFEQDERHPVVCLTVADIRSYLAWLGNKSGRVYRLPSELEWEYAARAGTETPYSTGTSITRASANIGRSRDGTTVGGLLAMNPWGISDMAGNVWEMTTNCRVETPRDGAPPVDAPECWRLLKGGSWGSPAQTARHAARRFMMDGAATNDVGFRVMREVDERDDGRILTLAQKRALAQAEKDAAEIVAKAKQSVEEERQKKFEEAEAAEAKKAAAKK